MKVAFYMSLIVFELQSWLGPWYNKVMDWYGILCRSFAYICCSQLGSVALAYWFDRFGSNLIQVLPCWRMLLFSIGTFMNQWFLAGFVMDCCIYVVVCRFSWSIATLHWLGSSWCSTTNRVAFLLYNHDWHGIGDLRTMMLTYDALYILKPCWCASHDM